MVFNWVSFLLFIIIGAFTPGPNNIMSMNYARAAGFKKGMIFIAGMFAGVAVIMTLCMIFSAALANIIPQIQLSMKIMGAAYILYLVAMLFIPSKNNKAGGNNGSFFVGMALQFINPKMILYGIMAVSTFITPFFSGIPVLAFFIFILTFVGFAANILWALFGALFNALFIRHGKMLNIIMAVLLLYCAVSLFL